MLLNELFSKGKKVLVLFPGRFQPFHLGHRAVYDLLCNQFGASNVFITTSNKVELPNSPFTFDDKLKMISLTGITPNTVVETKSPYQAKEIVGKYDSENTVLLFAVSEKDMDNDPRFTFSPNKDGSPSYYQPFTGDIKDCSTLNKHGYIVTVPTYVFSVAGDKISSASEIREEFAEASDNQQKKIFLDLYGTFNASVFAILKEKLTSEIYQQTIKESMVNANYSLILNEYKKKPVTISISEQEYNGWNLKAENIPKIPGEYRGIAKHRKSVKTPPIRVSGTSTEDVFEKLKDAININTGSVQIDPTKRVTIDFNVLLTRDIIGHSDTIYAAVDKYAGSPVLMISQNPHPGFVAATDRTALAARSEFRTGQHAFTVSGKRAAEAGFTHARYSIGSELSISPGIVGYTLQFRSEVHPGERISLSEPGVTVAYPKNAITKTSGAGELTEEDGMPEIKAWRDEVKDSFPEIADKLKFFSKPGMEISAEIPGKDRCYGVYDIKKRKGYVLGETHELLGSLYECAKRRNIREITPIIESLEVLAKRLPARRAEIISTAVGIALSSIIK